MCTVPNLINKNTGAAPGAWSDAGFTGPVTFIPEPPPNYKIQWQSLNPGDSVLCTSGITVRQEAP